MYLYKAIIYKDTQGLSIPDGTNAADKIDFETNYKSQSVVVNETVLAETTFVSEISYSAFKAKVTLWSNVKYIEDTVKYIINLISENPL